MSSSDKYIARTLAEDRFHRGLKEFGDFSGFSQLDAAADKRREEWRDRSRDRYHERRRDQLCTGSVGPAFGGWPMKGIRVCAELIADAETNYEKMLSDLDDRAELYADQFWWQVIIPFCNRHNLRFWSGNGTWFFEAPGGKTFDDPEGEILNWATLTGCAVYKDDPSSVSGKSWAVTCGEDEYPEFFYIYSEIERLLHKEFMGGHLGYWMNDFRPETFPLKEWEK